MSSKTKLKLLYILKMLHEETDERNMLTVNQIIDRLNEKEIKAERKSIYSDIELLNDYGFDILCEKGRANKYFMVSRDFEIHELKLLIDAILASKFITSTKSKNLIKKLEKLVSIHDAKKLHRNLIIANRIKSENESVYYIVDKINEAINTNKKICFKYFDYSLNYEKEYRYNGDIYEVSPYALMYKDDRYYMVAYHLRYEGISNFRVERMDSVELSSEQRYVNQVESPFNEVTYSKQMFKMFSGDALKLEIQFDKSLINVVFDRFGKDVVISKVNEKSFIVCVDIVAKSPFFSWIFGLGNKCKIVKPESAIKAYQDLLLLNMEQYK